ncbi:glycosyltransferase [Arthrobacter psychrochitiniphilus]|uniref:glycosyltransferase n=1 Tax=Arthrobacter psychrochitiniphilus TaxID=291045 RepID=UPI003F7C6782
MPRQELLDLYRNSDVVVVQGGPGSILDAREIGRIPIAIPRRADLGEVVDGHQKVFTEVMVQQGDAIMAESYEQLSAELERAIAEPRLVVGPPRLARPDEAASKLEAAIASGWDLRVKHRTIHRIKQLLWERASDV